MRFARHGSLRSVLFASLLLVALLLLVLGGSSRSARATSPYFRPTTTDDLKISPLGFITTTFDYIPGQTYVLSDRSPGSPDFTTALLDFNGDASSNVIQAWIDCGFNPVVMWGQWSEWCTVPGSQNVSQAAGPAQYWLGDGLPKSGPYYDTHMQWGEGESGSWFQAQLGQYMSNCHDMYAVVSGLTGNVENIPILDLYQDHNGEAPVHLRALPLFHIQNSYVDCSVPGVTSWHIEGVVVSVPPTQTPVVTPTASPTPSATSTPASQSILIGHVTWQGPPAQPSARQQLPLTVTLCGGGTPATYSATTDPSGFFTITTNLPTGVYIWRAKGPKYLAISGTLTLTGGGVTQIEMGQMKAGDLDNGHDNVVNTIDFTTLKTAFGQSSPAGDLNNDGITNTADFTLLKGNFGQAGSPANCP